MIVDVIAYIQINSVLIMNSPASVSYRLWFLSVLSNFQLDFQLLLNFIHCSLSSYINSIIIYLTVYNKNTRTIVRKFNSFNLKLALSILQRDFKINSATSDKLDLERVQDCHFIVYNKTQ